MQYFTLRSIIRRRRIPQLDHYFSRLSPSRFAGQRDDPDVVIGQPGLILPLAQGLVGSIAKG